MSRKKPSHSFDIKWKDFFREPQNDPDPNFPQGMKIDASRGRQPACTVNLPYPAKRCGAYELKCRKCKFTLRISTAGRADDPRQVTVACRRIVH